MLAQSAEPEYLHEIRPEQWRKAWLSLPYNREKRRMKLHVAGVQKS
jgi:hypothetical protein